MNFEIYGGRNEFWQWDSNQKLIVNIPDCTEVHFCNKTDDCSLVCKVCDGQVSVPNILLQEARAITVFAFVKNSDESHTKYAEIFRVLERTKPADYVYTETEVKTVERLVADALQEEKDSGSFVMTTEQTMTPEQRAQARQNIGAISEVDATFKGSDGNSFVGVEAGNESDETGYVTNGTFSFFASGDTRVKLRRIADGTLDTDAATVGQLKDLEIETKTIVVMVDNETSTSSHTSIDIINAIKSGRSVFVEDEYRQVYEILSYVSSDTQSSVVCQAILNYKEGAMRRTLVISSTGDCAFNFEELNVKTDNSLSQSNRPADAAAVGEKLGDIETAIDSIIAIQESLIGGADQ